MHNLTKGLNMSRYINTEILCESYTKFDIDIYDDKDKLASLKYNLDRFFSERAKFLFGEDVQVVIEFEKGSLKTKITVIGSAALALGIAIGEYGSFRQGVTQISSDAVMLTQSANLEMAFRTRAAYCDRLVMEKRPGVFGRLKNQLNELDSIRAIASSTSIPITAHTLNDYAANVDRLIQWDKTTDKLFAKFQSPDTIACVASGLIEEFEKFPEDAPWIGQLETQSLRSRIANMDPDFSGNIAGNAARYKAAIKSIKNKLMVILKEHSTKQT